VSAELFVGNSGEASEKNLPFLRLKRLNRRKRRIKRHQASRIIPDRPVPELNVWVTKSGQQQISEPSLLVQRKGNTLILAYGWAVWRSDE
jgi:hypothetical protein